MVNDHLPLYGNKNFSFAADGLQQEAQKMLTEKLFSKQRRWVNPNKIQISNTLIRYDLYIHVL